MTNIFSLFPSFFKKADEPIYDCREGFYMQLYRSTAKEDFLRYCDVLTSFGLKKIFENEYASISFACFTGSVQVNLLYTEKDFTLRISAAKEAALPNFTPKTVENKCETTFYMLENDHTLIDCGMCLIIQCSDYSFFVVDSGHYYQFNDNDRIYNFMRERTPKSQRVVVAGWFITHAHSDHISKFCDFLRYNMNDVVIEAVYSNLISNKYAEKTWSIEEMALAEKLFSILESSFDIPKIKLHTGQRFWVRNLMFDVLCTHEDIYPQKLKDYNDSSAVLMMHVDGTKVLIPGDASLLSSLAMEERFGNSLKCDIVQVAHHGHFGLRKEFYELSQANVALFPITQIMFDEEYEKLEVNRRLIEIADCYYVSSNGTIEIPLPYKKGRIKKLPDESFEDFAKIKGLWGYEYTDERKKELIELFKKNGGDTKSLYLPIID